MGLWDEPRPARMHKHTHVHHADRLAHSPSLLNHHHRPFLECSIGYYVSRGSCTLAPSANGGRLSRPSPCLSLGVKTQRSGSHRLIIAVNQLRQSCQPSAKQAKEQSFNAASQQHSESPTATCRPCCDCSPRLWLSQSQCCCYSPTPACTPSQTGVCYETSEARSSQKPAARGCSGNPCAPASTSPNSKPCSNMVNTLKQTFRILGSPSRTQTHQC